MALSCKDYKFYKIDGVELFNIFPGTFDSPIGIEPTYRNINKNQCSESNIEALSNMACFDRTSIDMGWDYDIYQNELYKTRLVADDFNNIECEPIYGENNSYYIVPYVYLKGLSNYYSSLNIWATNHLYTGTKFPPAVGFFSDYDVSYCPTVNQAGASIYEKGDRIECYSLKDTVFVEPLLKRVYDSDGTATEFQAFVGDLKVDIPSKTDTVRIYCLGDSLWSRPIYLVREGCNKMHTGISY